MNINGANRTELKLAMDCSTTSHNLSDFSGSLVMLTGVLYREVDVKHPRCARFSLKNEKGLFFVKVYEASLVELAKSFEPGTELGVVGEMHSFVNRRCHNHHVFIKAVALFPLNEVSVDWTIMAKTGTKGL